MKRAKQVKSRAKRTPVVLTKTIRKDEYKSLTQQGKVKEIIADWVEVRLAA